MQISKTTVFVSVFVIGLLLPVSVSAESIQDARENLREARKEVREERKDLLETIRARVNSKTGEVKDFLGAGRAAIGSGTITAMTDTTLTVEKDGKTYTVNFDANTQIRRRFWGKSELSEFSVGNVVNVIGHWADDAHTTINAKLIRNISIQKRYGVFFGEVKSLTSGGWVMSTKSDKRADQTVTISASTKLVNRRQETITQADVKVGHRVRVKGLWDRSQNTVTEVVQVKDFSLPPIPTGTVSPAATPTSTVAPTATPSPTATPTPTP